MTVLEIDLEILLFWNPVSAPEIIHLSAHLTRETFQWKWFGYVISFFVEVHEKCTVHQ